MVVEILHPEQEWLIWVPKEDDPLLDRVLEARRDGKVVRRWRYNGRGWICTDGPLTGAGVGVLNFGDLFDEIIAGCIKHDWTLVSIPQIGSRCEGQA